MVGETASHDVQRNVAIIGTMSKMIESLVGRDRMIYNFYVASCLKCFTIPVYPIWSAVGKIPTDAS